VYLGKNFAGVTAQGAKKLPAATPSKLVVYSKSMAWCSESTGTPYAMSEASSSFKPTIKPLSP
jgi:hypothetical protein